ncbi:hypothetical protein TruAng_003180 [Truncatella angustata]|nr:hypothetical protein TruAng_003180 [Truncatella angustata]
MTVTKVRVPLTPFDHCVPRAYYNGAIYLPLNAGITPARAFDLLHQGLHDTFLMLPWLNGQVHFQSPGSLGWRPGQLELSYEPIREDSPRPAQLRFKELQTDLDYTELQELGFPLDCFRDGDIAPTGFFSDPSTGPDVFVGQANFLPGGCIVVSAIHHAASDETAFFHFLRLWADHCASLQTHCSPPSNLPASSDDRQILRQIWKREALVSSTEDIDPETWRLVGLLPTDIKQTGALPNPASTPHALPSILRDLIAQELGVASGVSANDAVCALIWRCFMKSKPIRNKQSQA